MPSPIPAKRQNITDLEVFEILQALYPDEIKDSDCEWERLDEIIAEKFEIGVEEFCNVVSALVYLTPKLRTALSGKMVHAFGTEDAKDDGQFIAMLKREAVTHG